MCIGKDKKSTISHNPEAQKATPSVSERRGKYSYTAPLGVGWLMPVLLVNIAGTIMCAIQINR